MKLCIFGSRSVELSMYDVDMAVQSFMRRHYPSRGRYPGEIVCGMAHGADLCGRDYSFYRSIPLVQMPADFEKYGTANGGPERNERMARYCDAALGWWEPNTRGTANMATWMLMLKKPVEILQYEPQPKQQTFTWRGKKRDV